MSCERHPAPGRIRKALAKGLGWGIHFVLGKEWQVLIISPCLAEYYRARYTAAAGGLIAEPPTATPPVKTQNEVGTGQYL